MAPTKSKPLSKFISHCRGLLGLVRFSSQDNQKADKDDEDSDGRIVSSLVSSTGVAVSNPTLRFIEKSEALNYSKDSSRSSLTEAVAETTTAASAKEEERNVVLDAITTEAGECEILEDVSPESAMQEIVDVREDGISHGNEDTGSSLQATNAIISRSSQNILETDETAAAAAIVVEFVDDIVRRAIEQSVRVPQNAETRRESAVTTHVAVTVVKLVGIEKGLLPEYVDFDASLYHSPDTESRLFGASFQRPRSTLTRNISRPIGGETINKKSAIVETTTKDGGEESSEHRRRIGLIDYLDERRTEDITRCITRAFLNKDVVFFPIQLERMIKIKKKFEYMGVQLDPYVHEGVNGCQIIDIKPDSTVAKDGRLCLYDYIVGLNNESMRKISAAQAKNILRRASLIFGEIWSRVVYISNRDTAVYERNFHNGAFSLQATQSCTSLNKVKYSVPIKITRIDDRPYSRLVKSQDDLQEMRVDIKGQDIWGDPYTVMIDRNEDGALGVSVVGRKRKTINGKPGVSVIVKRIFPGSPAAKLASLRVGDRIVEINGVNIENMELDEVVAMLRIASSPVQLSIQRFKTGKDDDQLPKQEEKLHEEKVELEAPLLEQKVSDRHIKRSLDIPSEKTKPRARVKSAIESFRPTPVVQRTNRYEDLDGDIIEIILDRRVDETRLGLSLVGNVQPNLPGIFICDINPNSPAGLSGKFHLGDELLEVNRNVLYGKCHANATPIIKAMKGERIRFLIHRHPLGVERMAAKVPAQKGPASHTDEKSDQKLSDNESELRGGGGGGGWGLGFVESGDLKTVQIPNDITELESEDPNDPRVRPIVIGSPSVILIENENDDMYLGISLVGGVGTPMGAILIHDIFENGSAHKDGRLMVGDQILEVNGVDVTKCSSEECMELIRESISTIELKVIRGPNEVSSLENEDKLEKISVELMKKQNRGLGLSITKLQSGRGAYISGIIEGGCAEKDGRLIPGDVLLEVNGRKISKLAYDDIVYLLKTLPYGKVNLNIGRLKPSLNCNENVTTTGASNITTTDSSSFHPVNMLRAAASSMKQRHLRSRSAPSQFTRHLSSRLRRRKTTNVTLLQDT
ncbi:hypothetical protein ACOME3_005516 [Neoechinorhynchus agilis]